jgi:hypothetical protein
MSALRHSLKLIPPLPTGGIAKTVRPAVVGYIFSDLLPGNLALSWVTASQLTNGFLEKSNLFEGQLRQVDQKAPSTHVVVIPFRLSHPGCLVLGQSTEPPSQSRLCLGKFTLTTDFLV